MEKNTNSQAENGLTHGQGNELVKEITEEEKIQRAREISEKRQSDENYEKRKKEAQDADWFEAEKQLKQEREDKIKEAEKEITKEEKNNRAHELSKKRIEGKLEGDQDGDWYEAEKQLEKEREEKIKEAEKEITEEEKNNRANEISEKRQKEEQDADWFEAEKQLRKEREESNKELKNPEENANEENDKPAEKTEDLSGVKDKTADDKIQSNSNETTVPPVAGDTNNQNEKKVFKAAVVDLAKLAEAQARDVADSRMTEDKEDRSKNWLVRTAKRIWKHNLAQEWYRQREIGRIKKEILESGNLYAGETKDTTMKDFDDAKKAIVRRFTSEYEEEMLKSKEIKSKEVITDQKTKDAIKDLIKQFAADETMTEAAFIEQQNRILKDSNPDFAKEGAMYANSLFSIVKEIRNSIAHGEKLAEMDFDVEITLGKAEESLNTSAKHNKFEQFIEKTQNSKFGKYLFNEPAAVLVAAGLYSAGSFLFKKALRSNAAKIGTFGLTAGIAGAIAGSKEASRLNRERAQHIRESAKGMEFKDSDMKRRKEMEENRYETKNASLIIQNLENDLAKVSNGNVNEDELRVILANLSDIEARKVIGEKESVDLIAYSRFNKVEEERDKIDHYRAKLKVAIRRGIESGKIEFRQQNTFDEHLKKLTGTLSEGLMNEIEQKNKIFKDMKREKVAKVFIKTALIGASVGFIFQEVQAAFSPKTDGVFEGMFKHEDHLTTKATALEGLRRWITGDSPRLPFGVGHEELLGNTHIQLPDGVTLQYNNDGTCNILENGRMVSDHVKLLLDERGNLDDESIKALAKDGIYTSFAQVGGKVTEQVVTSPEEHISKHPGMLKIFRKEWMDNDTPTHPDPDHPGRMLGADKNELKLEWGAGGKGVENGNFVFQVNHMTDDGSYHEGLSVAAHEEMKKGGLDILLSFTKGTQNMVIPVHIDEFGKAVIDHTSEEGKMLFENNNGQAIFDGAFAEVGHATGIVKDGVQVTDILATHIGTDHAKEIVTDVVKDTVQTHVRLDVPADWDWNMPPIIPIIARRPLEKGEYAKLKEEGPDGSTYLYLTGSQEDRVRWEKNRSPRLKKNPDAILSQKEELDWYFKKQSKERGENYVKELDSFVGQNEVLKNLRKDTKIAVCMPVAAAQEYENVYNTLSLYSQQDKQSKEKTVIIMNVNWPDDADMTKVQKTIDEIEKAKKDFPDLQIATFTKTWSRSWIKEREGKVYGEVVKYINDTALRAIQKKNIENDVYLLTNDADAKGMSKHYLSTLINSTEKNKSKDGFLGKIEWSPELYEKYPGYHLSMRTYQLLESSLRASSAKHKNVASSGANFLVKASTFAAVGGYNGEMGAGADTDLGRSIKNARFGGRETLPEEKYPINYVNGAWIDTDPSRSFRYYKEGKGIVSQWNDFDEGGYQPRGDLALNENDSEDIEKDFKKIIERSSFQITALINDWISFDDVENYTRALNFAFPPQFDSAGKKVELWKIKANDIGKKEVYFTKEGENWLKKQLKKYKDNNLSELIYKRGVRAIEK